MVEAGVSIGMKWSAGWHFTKLPELIISQAHAAALRQHGYLLPEEVLLVHGTGLLVYEGLLPLLACKKKLCFFYMLGRFSSC